ncbi:MAG: hypothetical protein IMZ61_14600 [Planctomycetes bacterium]|nr:hypothetical protein [Planctomycetota bacterium]
MKISDWAIKEQLDTAEISADVDGFRLWYRLPRSYSVSRSADPFVAAALLPAMLLGQKIEISPGLSMSPKLLDNLQTFQEIHHCWNPIFKIISIEATTSPSHSLYSGAMSFFSGGVDSTYTFLKRLSELTHLVFIQGFDFFVKSGHSDVFSVGDLSDLSQLAFKLMLPSDAVSAFLKDQLAKDTLSALSNFRNSGRVSDGLEEGLVEEFDKIISGTPIWETKRFAGVRLRLETKQLLKKEPRGEDLHRLNRLLLEDAYPLEIARPRSETYETAINRNTRFAQSFGKTLIPLSTNHFPFGYRYNLSRNLTQGSALASVALLLGFSRVYVPAAYSYNQLVPLGSHPLTDPLWSSEGVQIIHEGAEARRVDKVVKIAGSEAALANLRVCFADMNINCGRCSKCMRTMIPLALLGASDSPFPPLPSPKAIRKMSIANEIELIFFKENFDPALGKAHPELRRALKAIMKRYQQRRLLNEIDKTLLGGLIKKAHRRLARSTTGNIRVDTTPPSE